MYTLSFLGWGVLVLLVGMSHILLLASLNISVLNIYIYIYEKFYEVVIMTAG